MCVRVPPLKKKRLVLHSLPLQVGSTEELNLSDNLIVPFNHHFGERVPQKVRVCRLQILQRTTFRCWGAVVGTVDFSCESKKSQSLFEKKGKKKQIEKRKYVSDGDRDYPEETGESDSSNCVDYRAFTSFHERQSISRRHSDALERNARPNRQSAIAGKLQCSMLWRKAGSKLAFRLATETWRPFDSR